MNEHLEDWKECRHALKARAGFVFFNVALKCQPSEERFQWIDQQWPDNQRLNGRSKVSILFIDAPTCQLSSQGHG